nr:protein-L-isoaspartate(D-aspartate) O-methyltransferase [Methanocella conradii]
MSERVLDAMAKAPRHRFVPKEMELYAYDDVPLPIGEGQTISAPSMVAIMCDVLDIKEGNSVLEVGTGLGYHAAVMSILAGPGKVYTIERKAGLAERARRILKELGFNNVEVFIGDGSEGLPQYAPFDRISVACAAPEIPDPLVRQLKDGGKMVIPIGQYYQDLYLVEKCGDQVNTYNKGGVAFVPLVGKYGFK